MINIKRIFILSKTNQNARHALSCLAEYKRTRHLSDLDRAIYFLRLALAYGRQLPELPKYRALRAHLVEALEAANVARTQYPS